MHLNVTVHRPLTASLEDAHLAVAVAGEPAARSPAVGRVNAQEEAGCWCRVVEGIDAEVEAASFAEKEVLELLQASFKVLSAPRAGACAPRLGPCR